MSRATAVAITIVLVLALVAFVVVSIATGQPEYILWSVVPLLGAIGYFVVAVRGETLGRQTRERDARIAARKAADKAAARQARSEAATGTTDS